MKDQLTIKELAPYLPYQLKVWHEQWCCELIMDATGSGSDSFSIEDVSEYAKPVLRPLSDLTKEIEHNGERFVPIEWLEEKYSTLAIHRQCKRVIEDYRWVNQCDHLLFLHLVEWHFDVFGLIDQGKAIDINTITK